MKTLTKGLFFTFEGGEGAGKTTLIEKIYDSLVQKDFLVLKTREPGGTKLSEEIRTLLLNRKDFSSFSARTELFLYLAARAQQVEEVILPALQKKMIVLCDRFNDSTIAYQGYGRGLDIAEVSHISSFATQQLIPDHSFFLDLDPQKGLSRVKKMASRKGGYDRIESESALFHVKVRNGYLAIAQQEQRLSVIDASLSANQVFALVWQEMEAIFHTFLLK